MEKESRLLLALLRIVVKKQADESIPTEVDWEKLMNIATTQVVPVIVLDGLQYYHSIHPDYIPFASLELPNKSKKRMQWIGQVMTFERMYAMHERAMIDLARLYASKGIFNQINAICVDHLGFSEKDFPTIRRNQELEERILMDILSPEFDEKKPNGSLFTVVWFKLRRWWANRWKHQLVYNDNLPSIFATLALSHLKRIKTIKD